MRARLGVSSSGGGSGGSPDLPIVLPGDVVAPAATGEIRLIARQLGGWPCLAWVDAAGRIRVRLPDLGTSRWSIGLSPDGANGTTLAAHGMGSYSPFGGPAVIQTPDPSSGRAVERAYGALWRGSGGRGYATLRDDYNNANAAHILRSVDFLGIWVGGLPDYQAGHEVFIGTTDTVAADPATSYTHAIGIVCRTTDTGGQWYLMHRGGGGASTLVSLGATLNPDDLVLFAVGWDQDVPGQVVTTVLNVTTGVVLGPSAEMALASNLPSLTQRMHWQVGSNNQGTGATAAVLQVAAEGFYGRWSAVAD